MSRASGKFLVPIPDSLILCRWWQWFEYCDDELGMCRTTSGSINQIDSASLTQKLNNQDEVSFKIERTGGSSQIPENYFCRWNVEIDETS